MSGLRAVGHTDDGKVFVLIAVEIEEKPVGVQLSIPHEEIDDFVAKLKEAQQQARGY